MRRLFGVADSTGRSTTRKGSDDSVARRALPIARMRIRPLAPALRRRVDSARRADRSGSDGASGQARVVWVAAEVCVNLHLPVSCGGRNSRFHRLECRFLQGFRVTY